MAGQNNKKNVIQYEFQGNILPLEEAFKKVGNLFRRYAREAKAAEKLIDPVGNPKGKLPKDIFPLLNAIIPIINSRLFKHSHPLNYLLPHI